MGEVGDSMRSSGKLRAAIYARVSTLGQVDGTSITTQVGRCRTYSCSQGWILIGEFVDQGFSGADEDRPALGRLLGYLRSGRLDVVVVAKLDRLGRSLRHLVSLLGELDDRGVRLVSLSEGFDSATPSGRLQRNILGSFAEFEREQIRERTMSGLLATARGGSWPGGPPPYGWRLVRDGRHTRAELDPLEVGILRDAAEMVAVDGLGLTEAARRLNSSGRYGRRGGRWDRTKLRRALSGPLAGERHYALAASTGNGAGDQVVVLRGPEMVAQPLREALRLALGATEGGRPPEPCRYLLSGRFESACGEQYTGARAPKQGPGYRCRRHARPGLYGAAPCQCRRVPAALVDTAVWEWCVGLLANHKRLEALARHHLGSLKTPSDVEGLVAAEARIARLEANLALTADYLRHGVPAFAVRWATAEMRREVSQLTAYCEKLSGSVQQPACADGFVTAASNPLGEATPQQRRGVVKLFGLQAKLLGWDDCPCCQGSGKARGLGPGARCQACHGARGLPVVAVKTEVGTAILRPRAPTP